MPKHPRLAKAPELGRSVIVLDGVHRGEVGRIMSIGGGFVWVKIAGVDELLGLPISSIDAAQQRARGASDTLNP